MQCVPAQCLGQQPASASEPQKKFKKFSKFYKFFTPLKREYSFRKHKKNFHGGASYKPAAGAGGAPPKNENSETHAVTHGMDPRAGKMQCSAAKNTASS